MWGSAGLFHLLTQDNPQEKKKNNTCLKYLFPGQSKNFDFLLSLQTTQWHSGALWWFGSSAGGHPSAPAWLGLHHPMWQRVPDCALVTEARDGKGNPTFLLKVPQPGCRTPASQAFSEEFVAWTNWCSHTFSRASTQPFHDTCLSAGPTRLVAKATALQEEVVPFTASQHLFLSSCALSGSVSHALCRRGALWAIGCWRSGTSVNGFLGVLEG